MTCPEGKNYNFTTLQCDTITTKTNCLDFNGSICTLCDAGKHLNLTGNCVVNQTNCLEESTTVCTKCDFGYWISGGNCSSNNAVLVNCKATDASTCIANDCRLGYYMKASSPTICCKAGEFETASKICTAQNQTNCVKFSTAGVCTECFYDTAKLMYTDSVFK